MRERLSFSAYWRYPPRAIGGRVGGLSSPGVAFYASPLRMEDTLLDPHIDDATLSARLRRLPGQLLLALLNGTAVLVIVASVLALVASAKINHLSHDVATTMTDAVLSRVAVKPVEFRRTLEGVSTDIKTLTAELKQTRANAAASLEPAVARLNERLNALQTGVERLGEAREVLINEAVAQASVSLGEALQRFGACKAETARQ